ncbi:MAG TPA: hypothetical protein VMR86_11715 [Myxococcota bacterium]|nr:hypothetical protein [Myxococcota bacterium]
MKKAALLAVGACVLALGRLASAGSIGTPPPSDFSVVVTSSAGGDPLSVHPPLASNGDGSFSGTAMGTTSSFLFSSTYTVNADPTISGSFSLTNLSSSTQLFSVSATISGVPLAGPTSFTGTYFESTYSDDNSDGSVSFASPTLAMPGTQAFMKGLIDAAAVGQIGAFNDLATGDAQISGTQGPETFSGSGPGVTSSIGVAFAFSVSPGDRVQVPFEFDVVPEPDGIATFAMGFALFLCTFAQKRASSSK